MAAVSTIGGEIKLLLLVWKDLRKAGFWAESWKLMWLDQQNRVEKAVCTKTGRWREPDPAGGGAWLEPELTWVTQWRRHIGEWGTGAFLYHAKELDFIVKDSVKECRESKQDQIRILEGKLWWEDELEGGEARGREETRAEPDASCSDTLSFKVSNIRGEEIVFQAHLYGMGQPPQSFAECHPLHHSPQWLDGTVKCRSLKQSSLSVSGGRVYEPHMSKEGGG